MIFYSDSEEKTEKLGEEFAKDLHKNSVVAFYGDLGAGKTAFIRGVCRYFGVTNVHSPTFGLVNEYEADMPIYHFDAYRIDADGWHDSGFDEYLDAGGICLIEWSENIELPPCSEVHITGSGDMVREIEIIKEEQV